jgi:hypothetical protein
MKREAGRSISPEERVRLEFPEDEVAVNPYYLTVAERYRAVSLLLWCALVVYLIVMLCLCRDSITYDNLTYLIKDFDADVIGYSESAETVRYDEGSFTDFSRYKGRMAAAGSKKFCMYSSSGAIELENSRTMENPIIVTSDKYVLEYDLGGTDYNIYSSLAKVYSGSSETAISAAALGENGEFALVSRSKESKYLVTVYNSSFKEIAKVYKDKFVMGTAFGDSGEYIIVSADVSESTMSTEIMFCKTGSDEASYAAVSGAMPLSVGRLGDGFCVICDSAIVFCRNGEIAARYDYTGTVLYGGISGDCAAVLCGDNAIGSAVTVTVFDENGEKMYDRSSDSHPTGFWCGGEGVAVIKTDTSILCFTPDGEQSMDNTDNVTDCVFYDNSVMVCTPSMAYQAFRTDNTEK